MLKPRAERQYSADQLIDKLRPKLWSVPGIMTFLQNPPPITITGQNTSPFTMTSSTSGFQTFVTAYTANKMIGFASMSTPASSSVVGNHAYAVVGYNATNQTITLFNPWGVEYGLVTMTWAQIQGSFSYFDRTA